VSTLQPGQAYTRLNQAGRAGSAGLGMNIAPPDSVAGFPAGVIVPKPLIPKPFLQEST